MFVSDWMTTKVFSVEPEAGLSEAAKILREKDIRHLPVVKDSKIKGIISDRDIKEYTPSVATSLDVYELHYLLAKTMVKEIMTKKVFTVTPDTPIEEAAMILFDKNIGCLPVEDKGLLTGIISDRDIYRALVDITGVRHGGHRIAMVIEDRPGSIKEAADIIRKYDFSLQSVLTSHEGIKEGYRSIVVRTKGSGNFKSLKTELESVYRGVKIRKG